MAIINGGSGNDNLPGTAAADQISGGSGNDWLDGLGGPDWLDGGSGNDRMWGRGGADDMYGGSGNDYMEGNAGDDDLDAGSGNDEVYGGSGEDRAWGGSGNDDIWGGADNDIAYGGSGADEMYGEAGDDFLYGDSGNDDLHGGIGADWLEGGDDGGTGEITWVANILTAFNLGDELWTGTGADTIRFDGLDDDHDLVHDFAPGVDRLVISNRVFADITQVVIANGPFGAGLLIETDDAVEDDGLFLKGVLAPLTQGVDLFFV